VKVRVVFPESLERELRGHLLAAAPLEHGAALLLGAAEIEGGVALLARRLILAPPDGFRIQEEARWAPSTAWLSRLVGIADEAKAGIALVHSHPMTNIASRSEADSWADELVAPFFSSNLGDRPFASLVLTEREIAGSAWIHGDQVPITEVRIPGSVLRRQVGETAVVDTQGLYERQILLFGEDGQRRLKSLSVAVVGVGGTGSAVSEQLVRMGVGAVMIVDSDALEESNVSRVYGSRRGDIGKAKVAVVGDALKGIGGHTRIVGIQGDVRAHSVATRVVRFADVIFGCTDTHSSRAVLNDIAYQYMTPTLDVGLRVGIGDSGPTSATLEMRTLRPDLPCLWCYGSLDGRRVSEEMMLPERRERLEDEGYVQRRQPAATIIPYTSLVGSFATARFLAMATGLTDYEPGVYVFDALTFDGWRPTTPKTECTCIQRQGLGDSRAVWMIDD